MFWFLKNPFAEGSFGWNIQPNIYMIYVKEKPYIYRLAEGKIMKPIENMVRDNVKNLKPCVHGAEVLGAAEESGLLPQEILDFSSSVNPLGPSKKALDAATGAFSQIAAYPDSILMNLGK
jgi:hypothetical protein